MFGIVLIAAGAILLWAVNVDTDSVNLHTIGAILIVVGIVEALFEMMYWTWFRNRWHDVDRGL